MIDKLTPYKITVEDGQHEYKLTVLATDLSAAKSAAIASMGKRSGQSVITRTQLCSFNQTAPRRTGWQQSKR